MEITYNNCTVCENEEIVIQNGHISDVVLNGKAIPVDNLPRLSSEVNTFLYTLNYGLKTFVIYKDMNSNLEYAYIYEQQVNDNKISIVDYKYTVVIPKDNFLIDLIAPVYSNEFMEKGLVQLEDLLQSLSYTLSPSKVILQIKDLLDKQSKENRTEYSTKLQQLETERNEKFDFLKRLKQATSKKKVEQKVLSREERIPKDKSGNIVYNGKTLRELAEEYGIKYKTLYSRLYYNGYTIEQALGIEAPPQRGETISSMCRDAGVCPNNVFVRLSRGESLEEAIEHCKKVQGRKEVYEGKTIGELSKEYDIPYATLHNRIHNQKMPVEQALKQTNYRKKNGGNENDEQQIE